MFVTERYEIPNDVVSDIKSKPYKFGFNGFGEIVYYTNYSRMKKNGAQERWIDTCKRVVEGSFSIRKNWYLTHGLKWDNQHWEKHAADMLYYMYTLKILPPGRGLWAQGTDYVYQRGSMALNNCGASAIREETFSEDIGWIMDALMCGTGVGLKIEVSNEFKDKLEIPKNTQGDASIHIIDDSREGWVKSVILLLRSYITLFTYYLHFNYDNVRKLGSPIKGFGGTASGPEPLILLHKRIRKYMDDFVNGIHDATRTFADVCNAVGCCIVAGNVRRCLPKGTFIHTNKGLIKIENIKIGDMVLTAKGYNKVVENIYQGKQNLLSIRTELGNTECTSNHKIAVLDNKYNYVWKQAKALSNKDNLVFIKNIIIGSETKLPLYKYVKPSKHSTTCKNITIPNLDSDMSWFFGMLHGNGYVYTNPDKNGFNAHVSLCTHKDYKDILIKCEEQFKRFNVNVYNPPNKDNCVRVYVQSKQLALYLSKFKIANKSINIPDFILQGITEIRGAYLAGLFDSDGSCKTRPLLLLSSIYYNFLKQVQALYATFGITTRLRKVREEKNNWKSLYNLTLVGKLATGLFREFITKYSLKYIDKGYYKFNSSLDNIIDNKISVKVLGVEKSGCNKTYDLSVENRNEFVIQEGLLVHNSALLILGSPNNETLINLKNYEKYPEREEIGWMSNNTNVFETSKDFMKLDRIIESIKTRGEPGLLNLMNVQKFERFGKIGKPDKAFIVNPCVVDATSVATKTRGIIKIKNLIIGECIWSKEGWTKIKAIYNNGEQNVYKYTTNAGAIYLTNNHKIIQNGDKVKIEDAKSIDTLSGFFDYKLKLNNQDIMDGLVIGGGTNKNGCYSRYLYIGDNDQDYFKNAVKNLILNNVDKKLYKVKSTITKEELPLTYQRTVPERFIHADRSIIAGFLKGLFSANGDVVCTENKTNTFRVSLRATSKYLCEQVQSMLSSLGIKTYVTTDKSKKILFKNGEYVCKEAYKVNITSDILKFHKIIGFIQNYKVEKLNRIISIKKKHYIHKISYKINKVEFYGNENVYDITVSNKSHTFWANGFNVSNCSEIPLENKELCNLIETFPIKAISKKDFLRMIELSVIYATSVSLLPTHNEESNAVIARNRRIGISLSGIADWFDKWGVFKIVRFMRDGYTHAREFSNYLSDQAGVPNPVRITTVKPSGTVSQLAGVSPGMHFPIHKYAIRRMRISNTSPILKICEQAGIPIESDYYSKGGMQVIEFPIFTGNTRPASEVSAWEQFSLLALLQREWSDNMVSSTITFKKEEEKDLSRMLAHFIPVIKSVSLLPSTDGNKIYPQMPYEKIDENEYNKRVKNIKKIDWNDFSGSDGKESKFCSNDSCEI